MYVGALEISLALNGNNSLKAKRKVVKSILGRAKARFNVSVAEVAEQNSHTLAVIGFSACGSEAKILNKVLNNVLTFVETNADAEVLDYVIDIDNFC